MTQLGVLSEERIAEIKAFRDKPDPECLPMTDDFFKNGHFRNPEAAKKAIEEMRRQKQENEARDKRDIELINAHTAGINAGAEGNLEFQADI
jgi:hypothetical protein